MNKVLWVASSFVSLALATSAGCHDGSLALEAPLATGQIGIVAMANDAFYVYWTMSNGEVRRISVDGGAVETIATGAALPSTALAIDKDTIYWVDGAGILSRVAKAGGAVTAIAQISGVSGLAVDDTQIFVTTDGEVKSISKTATVESAVPAVLASGLTSPHALWVTGSLLFSNGVASTNPDDLTAPAAVGGIAQLPIGGGAAQALTSDGAPKTLSVGSSQMAWTDVGRNAVRVASLDGSQVKDIAVLGSNAVTQTKTAATTTPELVDAVISDDENVYFSSNLGALRVTPLAGGEDPQVIMQGPPGFVRMTQSSTTVYAANDQEGAIMILHKAAPVSENIVPDPSAGPVPNPVTSATE